MKKKIKVNLKKFVVVVKWIVPELISCKNLKREKPYTNYVDVKCTRKLILRRIGTYRYTCPKLTLRVSHATMYMCIVYASLS